MLALLIGAILAMQPGLLNQEKIPVLYDSDSYSVYSAVLNAGLFGDDREAKRILVFAVTQREDKWGEQCPTKLAKHDPAVRTADAAYWAANEQHYLLQPYLELQKPYRLITIAEWNRFFAAAVEKNPFTGWERFRQFNPGVRGLYQLSAVGFNNARDAAIVYVAFDCGPLCAQTERLLVRRKDGKWKSVINLGCGGVS